MSLLKASDIWRLGNIFIESINMQRSRMGRAKLLKRPLGLVLSLLIFVSIARSEETPDEQVEMVSAETGLTNNSTSADKCMLRRVGCCSEIFMGDEEVLMQCLTLHQNKMPSDDEKDMGKLIKFLSCLVECTFKRKKYMGKGDNLNMKMVKADAEKMYADRPKERDYHIEMYEFCRKDGLTKYTMIKNNPATKFMLREACKPYFVFVFLCQAEYHKKHKCPYFKWDGKKSSPNEEICKEEKNKCYEHDGITPP